MFSIFLISVDFYIGISNNFNILYSYNTIDNWNSHDFSMSAISSETFSENFLSSLPR